MTDQARDKTRASLLAIPSVREALVAVRDTKAARDAALADTAKKYNAWAAAGHADDKATEAHERAIAALHAALDREYPR